MSLFDDIKTLLARIKRSTFLETNDSGAFYVDEDSEELHWNSDGNLEDLYEGNGSSYTVEINGACWEQDGCSFFNTDNGCGETITMVFDSRCEVDYDDLEEMFNGDEEE